MWQSAADFLLRRLLKALLKRHLKHMLATELDVEQLRCSLGKGSFELHDVLLSSDWLAAQAVSIWLLHGLLWQAGVANAANPPPPPPHPPSRPRVVSAHKFPACPASVLRSRQGWRS